MSVSGLCEVCESARADERCEHCGAFVCLDHYDRDLAMCTACAADVGGADDGETGGDRFQF
jgi:hypothetical protein